VLQEQNAEAGDCIVRARGAWFGNRSISAEVDLPVGTYEVLPKIEASRDADAPDVHEVVTKVAERNPQKLRQIGLNYDIANAKGLSVTDEERKEKGRKKKQAAYKKKKKLEDEAKEKADFEAWKREEKAEYEAWKKEKSSQEAKEAKMENISKVESEDVQGKKEEVSTVDKTAEPKDDPASPSTVADEAPKGKESVGELSSEPETGNGEKAAATKAEDVEESSDEEEAHNTLDDDVPLEGRLPTAPSSIADGPPSHQPVHGRYPESAYARHPESVYGNVPPPPPPRGDRMLPDNAPKPWNAVCVLGLRVYSQDPEVSIKLVKPKDAEEGAILDVDGNTAAGATM